MSDGTYSNNDGTLFTLFVMVLFIGLVILMVNIINSPSSYMDDFCIDNGFEKVTDYIIKNNTLIECDNEEVFNTIRIIECSEINKWGDCEWWRTKEYIISEESEK